MRIACFGISRATQKFIIPFLKALKSIGCKVGATSDYKKLKSFKPDFCIITSSDFKCVYHSKIDWHLEKTGIPYASIWFQAPLRNLYTLRTFTSSMHRGMFVPDSTEVIESKKLGFQNVFYFPSSWWVDIDCFKPMPSVQQYRHDVAWDCTFEVLSFILRRLEKSYSDEQIKAIINNAKETFAKQIGSYINPFDFLKETDALDIWSEEFQNLQSDLLILQKSMERAYILRLLRTSDIEIHIYGGFSIDHNKINLNHRINKVPKGMVIHDYIDTYTELPKLYASSKILLSRMMLPSAPHDRLFCAAATKGFVLSEWKDDAARVFEPGKEIIMYRDIRELPSLIKYYLKHENERKRLAEAAHKRFMAEHTPLHRAKEFVEIVKGLI